jgi:hypothetical protein
MSLYHADALSPCPSVLIETAQPEYPLVKLRYVKIHFSKKMNVLFSAKDLRIV